MEKLDDSELFFAQKSVCNEYLLALGLNEAICANLIADIENGLFGE
jgi:hypothetical protein